MAWLSEAVRGGFSLQRRPLLAAFHEVSRAVNEFEFDKALQLLAPLLG
ncbi:hypothetical protein [Aeromonas veronii]